MAFRHNKSADIEAGLFFTLFGSLTAMLSLQYRLGTVAMMGPGMFPLILGVLLTIIGLAILAKGLLNGKEMAKDIALKPALFVAASLLVFAFLVVSVGLLVAVPAQVFVALWASHHFTLRRAITLSAGILAFCYVVFLYLLGISVPMIAV